MKSLETTFHDHADPLVAAWQEAYMKHQFSFLGIKKPLRQRLQKPHLKQLPKEAIRCLWEKNEREFQYTAMDLYLLHEIEEDDLPLLQGMITSKSWWDTVDMLASNHCGTYFRLFPSQISMTQHWIESRHLWLRRSALLFQLHYKTDTNSNMLFSYCLATSSDTDPFIQRAIGWALREYGKTAPKTVLQFVAEHTTKLSSTARREATCLLTKNR